MLKTEDSSFVFEYFVRIMFLFYYHSFRKNVYEVYVCKKQIS